MHLGFKCEGVWNHFRPRNPGKRTRHYSFDPARDLSETLAVSPLEQSLEAFPNA